MKKMWKMRKDKSAVSPVIATILMVAITVVLAAVLYVMVMGFGGTQSSTPTGSMTVTSAGVVTFGQISPDTKYTDCKILVQDQITGGLLLTSGAITVTGQATAATLTTTTATTVTAAGFNPSQNGKVSNGDTITLSNGVLPAEFLTGHTYKVSLMYVPTGGIIASKTFISS